MQLSERLKTLPHRTPYLFPSEGVPARFRQAAVMILLWEEAGAIHTLLTLRASHLSSFANQMCFPGGRLERWWLPDGALCRAVAGATSNHS